MLHVFWHLSVRTCSNLWHIELNLPLSWLTLNQRSAGPGHLWSSCVVQYISQAFDWNRWEQLYRWTAVLKIKHDKKNFCFLLSEKGNWNETDVLCCRRCSSSFPLVQCLPFISISWLPVLHACCRRLVVTMWWSPALLKTDAVFVTVTAPPVRQWGERLRRVKASVCFWPFFTMIWLPTNSKH